MLKSGWSWLTGRLVPVVALAVWIGAAGCEGGLVAPRAEVTEDVDEAENMYSCHVDQNRGGSGIVCVTDDPGPAIFIAFAVGVASSAVVAIIINELGANPGWLRHAERTCQHTAAREGWYELELIYDAETGELIEWNCVEAEY